MTTLDYVREMENDQEDERQHERELQEAAWYEMEAEYDMDEAEDVLWAIKHGLIDPNA